MARKKILVVEDDADLRAILARLLSLNGYDVREAASGAEAVALLAEDPADLVLTDYMMPRMDGITLAKLVCAQSPTTPVVLLTGCLLPNTDVPGEISQVIAKPAKFSALLSALRRLVPSAVSGIYLAA